MKKILIIDDSAAMRKKLSKRIQKHLKEDVEIVEAGDGLSGIKSAVEHIPDLILMDIVLPYLSGYAASVRLKNIDRLQRTRIVGMTSRVEADTREKILTWCDDFLAKPIQDKALARILDDHLYPEKSRKGRDSVQQKRLKKVTVEIVNQLEDRVEELTGLNLKLEKQTRVIRNLYRETKRAKSRLKRLNQIRADFTDLLSHEIKTPLTAISGYAECLELALKDGDEMGVATMVDNICESSSRIAALVNEISRLNRLKFDLRAGHVCHVCDTIRSVLDQMADHLSEAELTATLSCNDQITVQVDRRYLSEMLSHLLKNAVIYNVPGGSISIDVTADSANLVKITIRDTGLGIDPAVLGDIFTPLVQLTDVEHHRTHPLRGLGMGLTVSREMAQNVGGALTIESAGSGSGTTAVLTLPRAESHVDTETGN